MRVAEDKPLGKPFEVEYSKPKEGEKGPTNKARRCGRDPLCQDVKFIPAGTRNSVSQVVRGGRNGAHVSESAIPHARIQRSRR